MGCGKSKRGRKLAAHLGFEFVDMDEWIEKRDGRSIPEIFEIMGENYFRMLEYEALLSFSLATNLVISTGGGSPCFFDAMDVMNQSGVTIYLKANPTFLRERLLESKKKRPLIEGMNAEELQLFIESKLKEREPFYKRAHYCVEAIGLQTKELSDIVHEARFQHK